MVLLIQPDLLKLEQDPAFSEKSALEEFAHQGEVSPLPIGHFNRFFAIRAFKQPLLFCLFQVEQESLIHYF